MSTNAKPDGQPIESLLVENRTFSPPPAFTAAAHVRHDAPYREAHGDYEAFWAKHAAAELAWFRHWNRMLDWNAPWAKWFVGGQLNVSHNCVDRHVEGGSRTKAAI
ncbi:MAG: acetyl-coenzyme A synthetase, partial [Armatimonadetes bacterium]|nr:acetyl-coenzyme A synthetase [Armatimonadota bacterium]